MTFLRTVFLVWAYVGLLLAQVSSSVASDNCSKSPQGASNKSADQLWAEALWKSLPGTNATSSEIKELLTAALAKTDRRAALYVALGDVDSGSVALRESMSETVKSVEDAAIEAQKEPEDGEDEAADGAAQALLQKAASAALDGFYVRLKNGKATATECYAAATRVDPNYKLAWQKLAIHAEGDVALKAIEGWINSDSDNALPHFLRAAAEAERGGLETALKSVRTGNSLPACRSYMPETPAKFLLEFPAEEQFVKRELAGTRISRSGLEYLGLCLDDLQPFGEPMSNVLGKLGHKLREHAKQLETSSKRDEAIDCYETIRLMGVRLMCIDSTYHSVMNSGYYMTSSTCTDELRALYNAHNDANGVNRLDQFQAARSLFRERYFETFLKHLKPTDANVKSWLAGKVNFTKAREQLLKRAIQESGLLAEIVSSPR